MVAGLLLFRSYAGTHSFCEFRSQAALLSQKTLFICSNPWPLGLTLFLLSTSAVFPEPWGERTETDVPLSTSSFNSHLSCCTLHTAFLTSLYVFHPAWQPNTRISWQSKKWLGQDQWQVLNPYYSPSFPQLFHILQRLIKDEIKLVIVLSTALSINVIRFQQNKVLNKMFILHSWC